MGTTGPGLYANDFAMDLRSTIGAVARLPFDGERLIEILCGTQPVADNRDDEDYSNFWLVTADQFAKRGIVCERARETALGIIDSGRDLAMLEKLGMNPRDLAKRKAILTELRGRIASPIEVERRNLLKKPQPFVMAVGDVLVYPTSGGECINSYFSSKEKIPGWHQDGWGAAVIVEHGRAFDFLAWYRPLSITHALDEKPALARLQAQTPWVMRRAGTCSAVHFKRLELEKIGALAIDPEKLARNFPERKPGIYEAVNDISITGSLGFGRAWTRNLLHGSELVRRRFYPTIAGLDAILE